MDDRTYLVAALAAAVILVTILPAFAPMEDDSVYQESVIGALVDGWYDGDITCDQLLDHGDLGLGTVDAIDGELVILDGHAYVVDIDGSVRQVPGNEGIPFADVCHFDVDLSFDIRVDNLSSLESAIDAHLTELGMPVAVRIMGSFSELVCRSVPAQEHPYPPLVDVVANQSVFDLGGIDGTMVGFRMPDSSSSLTVAGYHLHFLSADLLSGGHVLSGGPCDVTVQIDICDGLHVHMIEGASAIASPDLSDIEGVH